MRYPSLATWVVLLGCGATACGDEERTARGELGEAEFFYECVDESDYQCFGEERGVPELIGVGALFDLDTDEFFADRNDIRAGSPETVETTPTSFRFKEPGPTAFLLLRSGGIEDFVHLYGAEVRRLRLRDTNDRQVLHVGLREAESFQLAVVPDDGFGHVLGGAFAYEWVSEDESIVVVTTSGGSNQARLSGRGVGPTRVRVSFEDISATFDVDVAPNPGLARPDDGGGPRPDAAPSESAVVDGGNTDAAADPVTDAAADAASPTLDDAGSGAMDASTPRVATDAATTGDADANGSAGARDGGTR